MVHWRGGRNRRGIIALCIGASAGVLGVAALGQATRPVSDATLARAYPPPYGNSKSDKALKLFDEAHPACELWSDWHKLCSRTGPKGSTYCRTDPEHPATASAPFCAKGSQGFTQLDDMSAAERQSVQRYVTGYQNIDVGEQVPGQSRPSYTKHVQVPTFDPGRPFAGRTLGQLEHPYCAAWMVEKEDGTLGSCAEDGRRGVPSCKSPKIRNRVNHGFPVCIEKIRSRICNPNDPVEFNTTVDVIGNVYSDVPSVWRSGTNSPVYGYSCPAEFKK